MYQCYVQMPVMEKQKGNYHCGALGFRCPRLLIKKWLERAQNERWRFLN